VGLLEELGITGLLESMVYYLLPRSYRLKPAGPGRHTAQARADPAAGGVVQVSNAPGGFGEFLGNVHRVRRARLACRKREAIQTARPDFCPANQPRGVPDWKGLLPSVDQAGALSPSGWCVIAKENPQEATTSERQKTHSSTGYCIFKIFTPKQTPNTSEFEYD
jgi:hypothetical protein